MLLFKKLVDETQLSAPPKDTRHHNSRKLLVFLPLRAIKNATLQYEIPCILFFHGRTIFVLKVVFPYLII